MIKYRPDIDGLRAIAVLAVILYHLGVPGFSGGFVGVDVFFVISGYLITLLIDGESQKKQFSVLRFYERRVRRILPALFIVMACTIPFAAAILLPADLKRFGESVATATAFSSNFQFWLQSGYFAPAARSMPLLHTWSLAIEEQFYLVYPLVFLGMRRTLGDKTWLAMLVLAFISLSACVFATYVKASSAFYLPQYRMWELLMGGIAALAAAKTPKGTGSLSVIGLAAIFVCTTFYSDQTPFPGLAALLPTFGAVLIIIEAENAPFSAGTLLRLRPLTFIGRISYSAYLWHWPIIALSTYYLARDLGTAEKIGVGGITLLLSIASWWLIEQPARRISLPRARVFAAAGIAASVLFGLGITCYVLKGLPERFSIDQAESAVEIYGNTCFLSDGHSAWSPERCTFGGQSAASNTIFLWGDSFAAHYLPGLRRIQKDLRFNLVEAAFAACRPLPSFADNSKACNRFNEQALKEIERERPRLVILSARWDYVSDTAFLRNTLESVIRRIKSSGARVLIIDVSPIYELDPNAMELAAKRRNLHNYRSSPIEDAFRVNETIRQVARQTGSGLFSPSEFLCDRSTCRYSDGKSFYFDSRHFSEHGSIVLARAMRPLISSLIHQRD